MTRIAVALERIAARVDSSDRSDSELVPIGGTFATRAEVRRLREVFGREREAVSERAAAKGYAPP